MAESKPIWQSKTFWLAVVQIVLGILTALQDQMVEGASITLLGLLFITLRVVSKSPVFVLDSK
jgi:uncharacterized membrane protein